MKRALILSAVAAVIVFASFGTVMACGDETKAQPAVAHADHKEGCGKAVAAAEPGCGKGCCPPKDTAVIAKTDAAAAKVDEKPCGAVAEGAGCARKSKAVDVAKADGTKPADVAENAK